MREILFRGKTKDNVWYHGFIKGKSLPNFEGNKLEFTPCIIEQPYADIWVIPETIGQYTGLTDKNGKKIFEGDILKGAWDTIFQVVYDDCYLGFRAKEKDGMHNCIDYYGLDLIEVIGNIHDNPELLEEREG